MRHRVYALAALALGAMSLIALAQTVQLPDPQTTGTVSLEETLAGRRSRREFTEAPLTLPQLGQMLWAAQGLTYQGDDWPYAAENFRTAPSAGGVFPLTIYTFVFNVEGLAPGMYCYSPSEHSLDFLTSDFTQATVNFITNGGEWITDAPIVLVIAADVDAMIRRYPWKGETYVHIEVGHVGQNIYLQAEALNLSTCIVGAFIGGNSWPEAIRLPERLTPFAILPVGHRVPE